MCKTISTALTFAILFGSLPTAGAETDRYPYPHNHTYAHGIVPTNFSQAQKNADLEAMWKAWRNTYLTHRGAGRGELRVSKNGAKGESVSEGIGYGLLISVYMANPTNSGKADFDSLYLYYKRHEKVMNGTRYGLMAWRVGHRNEVLDNYVAPDGDIDAAFSLLMADRKWGSDGAINYRQAGMDVINSLMKWSINKPSFTVSKGEMESSFTMSSYHIVNYFPLFATASGDPRWEQVIASSYKMYDYFYQLNPKAALTPFTFTISNYSASNRGYHYGYDSSRVPWRVGVDYLWHGTRNSPLARTLPDTNAKWLKEVTGGKPAEVNVSYELNGRPVGSNHDPRVNVPPIAVGAMVDASNQEWLNTLYAWMRVQVPGATTREVPPSYFGDAVMLSCMLVLTGNMPEFDLPASPAASATATSAN